MKLKKTFILFFLIIFSFSNLYFIIANIIPRLNKPIKVISQEIFQDQKLLSNLSVLMQKNNKTAEDWIELARVQDSLNQPQDSFNSLAQARQLDPIRDDIEKLYFSSFFSASPSASFSF